MSTDRHDLEHGGHAPVDVDPFIPTGQCAICQGVNVDERVPEERGPDNPYESGVVVEPDPEPQPEGESAGE